MRWDVMTRMWRHCNVKQCHGTHPYGAPFVYEIHGSGSWMDVSDGPLTWMEFWNKWHGFLPGADCFRSQPWEQPVRDSRYGSRESVEGEAGVDCGWIKESKDRRKASVAEQHIPVAKPIWNKFQGRSETSWFFVYILTELYAMQYIPRNMYNSRFVMLVWHAHLPVLLHWHRGDCPGIILGMGSANERRCHYVTPSLIGWAQAQNDPGCPSGSEETLRRMRVHGFVVI